MRTAGSASFDSTATLRWSEWNSGRTAPIGGSGTKTLIPVERLFEDRISVRDLERSIGFYRDMLGMEVGLLHSRSPEGMGGSTTLGRRTRPMNIRSIIVVVVFLAFSAIPLVQQPAGPEEKSAFKPKSFPFDTTWVVEDF